MSNLSHKGVVDRCKDDADCRRTIMSITEANREAVDAWLAHGCRTWRSALEPLTSEQRRMFVETLRAYERAVAGDAE
ncbi:MAG: winged helix-turn-helix transcriptional regulator [Microbispora sp.]|nr:winged helix-turn-helix transcriptional regulator [Microbispora sp.]